MKLDKNKIIEHYDLFKKYAFQHFAKNDIEKTVKFLHLTARIGYNYNFKYCDDDLEKLIYNLSDQISGKPIHFQAENNRIVFYDSFGNNRVLALQYLRAIVSMNFELLYIYSSKVLDKDVEKELNDYPESKIIHLDKESFSENVKYAQAEIINFKPFAILEHFLPWDILGFCIFSSIKSSKRYLINLTDHAFWLGKNCADYILEFRNYGIFLSHHHRKIPFEKLLLQPYYPIDNNVDFKGFPVEKREDNIIVFAGSDFYKIFGKDGYFFKIVKRILAENGNVIFLLAGHGNEKPIKAFIKEHNLQSRFILLGYRKDINQIIKHIDIYLNTYPLIGGLMSQYAAVNNKPIVGFTDKEIYSFNDTEDLLQTKNKGLLVRTSLDDFHSYINLMIRNESERINNIESTRNCVITPINFNELLSKNLLNPEPVNPTVTNNVKVNLDSIYNLYVDMEVNFLKMHYIHIWRILEWTVFLNNLPIGIKAFFHKGASFLQLRFKRLKRLLN